MMERNLLYTQQALRKTNRFASVKKDKIDVVLSTLRIQGLDISKIKTHAHIWLPPYAEDSCPRLLMWERKSGKSYAFDIVKYNKWRKHIKLQASNAERVRPTR